MATPPPCTASGRRPRQGVDAARITMAECLHCRPDEVFITSGGSEADNWALKMVAESLEKKGKKHIVSTVFEHHAILHALNALEKRGFEITLLPVYETASSGWRTWRPPFGRTPPWFR